MKRYLTTICLIIMITLTTQAQPAHQKITFNWSELPPIPDQFGFAGSFAGVSNNALIVAGGANFPDGGAPWTGSKKVWTDKIFVLEKPGGQWKMAGKLPEPLGYGVSITCDDKLLCIGGSNANGHKATVYAISFTKGRLRIDKWPALPQPLANSSGVLLDDKIYLAGGLLTPDAKTTAHIFWSFDARHPSAGWKELPAWPGPPRMLSVAGAAGHSFYLFSGTDLEDKNGAAHRHYLTDAYRYNPITGWKKLADLPDAVVAAPGPAYHVGNELLVFGGDDGKLADAAASLKEKHPGFSTCILSFDINKNIWTDAGSIKTEKKPDVATNPNGSLWAPVTNAAVIWHGKVVFPGGEVRPAIRTPRVPMVEVIKK